MVEAGQPLKKASSWARCCWRSWWVGVAACVVAAAAAPVVAVAVAAGVKVVAVDVVAVGVVAVGVVAVGVVAVGVVAGAGVAGAVEALISSSWVEAWLLFMVLLVLLKKCRPEEDDGEGEATCSPLRYSSSPSASRATPLRLPIESREVLTAALEMYAGSSRRSRRSSDASLRLLRERVPAASSSRTSSRASCNASCTASSTAVRALCFQAGEGRSPFWLAMLFVLEWMGDSLVLLGTSRDESWMSNFRSSSAAFSLANFDFFSKSASRSLTDFGYFGSSTTGSLKESSPKTKLFRIDLERI
ncbi:hypothetical protein FOCC_FOCC007641 [Frankliniella occidentalis]|nr:hypothetical protein FOCC_FOCC007641 [Frankliniella occidentalis]